MKQATIEERVAYLEGKVEEQSHLGTELKDMVIHLDQKVDRFREELSERIEATNRRIETLDQKVDRFREELSERIEAANRRIETLDQKVDRFREELSERIEATNRRIETLDQKGDRFREELSLRIDGTNQRIDTVDQRLSSRIEALDHKFSRYFLWIIGIQITILLAIIGALLR